MSENSVDKNAEAIAYFCEVTHRELRKNKWENEQIQQFISSYLRSDRSLTNANESIRYCKFER